MGPAASARNRNRRTFWLKQLRQWHWISSALSLIGMLAFAVTGITLNHASQIEARPVVTTQELVLPQELFVKLSNRRPQDGQVLPREIAAWLDRQLSVPIGAQRAEWSDGDIHVTLSRPGGDAWVSIDRKTGEVLYERTDRGWVAYFNDLHKGRNAGEAWRWFIDAFAVACAVFCLTGLFLLQLHAGSRPVTWPIVGFGFVLPLLLAILFIH
ncbi:MAG: PepSY-associated TM helix domain-containing protein [Alphaproteobacteria bacterium]